MKIFNIMLSEGKGGLENMAHIYADIFRELGHEVFYIGQSGDIPLIYHGWYDFKGRFIFNRLLAAHKPDLLILHGNRAISMAANCDVKKLGVIHNDRFNPADIEKLNGTLAVSGVIEAKIHEIMQGKTTVFKCYNAVPLLKFVPKKISANPVLGFIGRLHERKGVDILLKAAAGRPLIIAGDGQERKKLESLANDKVKFIGWVEDKDAFFAQVDLIIIPSREEAFGLTAIEAMSAGVPVIAAHVGGLVETISHNQDGFLVPPDDPQALSAMIDGVLATPLTPIIKAAKRKFDKEYSLEALKSRLSKILDKV